jgi:hypothetical protein
MKALSLDVGPSRFMVAEGNLWDRRYSLKSCFRLIFPWAVLLMVALRIKRPSALLLKYVEANKVRTRNTIVTVSSNAMIIRRLEVPHASEKDTKNLVNVEMQQYLPSERNLW